MTPMRCLTIATLAMLTTSGGSQSAVTEDDRVRSVPTTDNRDPLASETHSVLPPIGTRRQPQGPQSAAAAAAESRQLQAGLLTRYRRSVELWNALRAFSYDVTDEGSLHGSKRKTFNSGRNVTTACLVIDSVSLPKEDGSRSWKIGRRTKRTVVTLSLHLVEFQTDDGASHVDPQSSVSQFKS
jgi:hypothetical protein